MNNGTEGGQPINNNNTRALNDSKEDFFFFKVMSHPHGTLKENSHLTVFKSPSYPTMAETRGKVNLESVDVSSVGFYCTHFVSSLITQLWQRHRKGYTWNQSTFQAWVSTVLTLSFPSYQTMAETQERVNMESVNILCMGFYCTHFVSSLIPDYGRDTRKGTPGISQSFKRGVSTVLTWSLPSSA